MGTQLEDRISKNRRKFGKKVFKKTVKKVILSKLADQMTEVPED